MLELPEADAMLAADVDLEELSRRLIILLQRETEAEYCRITEAAAVG